MRLRAAMLPGVPVVAGVDVGAIGEWTTDASSDVQPQFRDAPALTLSLRTTSLSDAQQSRIVAAIQIAIRAERSTRA